MQNIDEWGLKGVELSRQGEHEQAIEWFSRVVAVQPNHALALANIGKSYAFLDRHAEALPYFAQATNILRADAGLLVNLGLALRRCGHLEQALHCFTSAVNSDPHAADARGNRADLLLLYGQFEEGWREYEWRHAIFRHFHGKTRQEYYGIKAPIWDGLATDHLVIHTEQGFGDTIQSLRYVRQTLTVCDRVTVVLQPSLVSLATASFADEPRIRVRSTLPKYYDSYVWIDSLPHLYQAGIEPIPNDPYLQVPPSSDWQSPLRDLVGPKVGIVLNGLESFLGDRHRSVPQDMADELLSIEGIQWVSLQKDRPLVDARVFDASPFLGSWLDTARIVQELDLIVSVDTSVVHLAGAMGRPVWLLNRYDSCWRWGLERSECEWYPSVTIFRQPSPDDWKPVIEMVAERLRSEDSLAKTDG